MGVNKKNFGKGVRASMPKNIVPMAMTLSDKPFNSKEWIFELKWDGFRCLAYCQGKNVELKSKNNNSFNKRFSLIKSALEKFSLNAVLDGEIVALNADGTPDFNKIL